MSLYYYREGGGGGRASRRLSVYMYKQYINRI